MFVYDRLQQAVAVAEVVLQSRAVVLVGDAECARSKLGWHPGIPLEVALAAQLEGLDLMVAGGGDEVLGDPSDLYVPGDEESIYGPYPLWATSASGVSSCTSVNTGTPS